MGKFFGGNDGSFLLSLDAVGPGERAGRRGRKRQKGDTELAAEKKPRTQERWREDERQRSRLPTADGPRPPDRGTSEDGESKPGKKKQRRIAVLAAKKARQEQKKVTAAQKAAEAARQALKGKASTKAGEVREAASKLLASCTGGTAGEQRLLAMAAERIAANPQGELELFDVFFELHHRGGDARTRRLAMLSAVALFRDLVPGYRIREPTEQERSWQRSKEGLVLAKHEMELLHTYKRLLPLLEAAMRKEPLVFAPALSALVRAAFDFNYRQRLINTAVGHACGPDAAVRRAMSEGLQEMFEADMRLEASREAVLAVGRVAQGAAASAGRRRRQQHAGGAPGGASEGGTAAGAEAGQDGGAPAAGDADAPRRALGSELLKALLHIPVGRAETAELRGDAGDFGGADEEVRRGLAEASISHNVQHLRKAETELLYEVFVVYLRILRQRHVHGRELLAAVLTGLARWGQHVNLELLLEILGELRHAVEDALGQSDGLVALQGLNCALSLLGGPSQALVADASWLADAMARGLSLALPALHRSHSESEQWPPARCFSVDGGGGLSVRERELSLALEAESVPGLLLRCLEAALRCPQGYGKTSDAALAALAERLFLLAAGADAHVGLAVLREAAQLLRKHHRLHVLLDVEGGLFGLGGVTDRAVSVVWHLQPLAFSLLPELARASGQLPAAVPQRRALLAEIFPMKDAGSWLQAEFTRHIAALSKAPSPRAPHAPGPGRRAAFLTEAELCALCGGGPPGRTRAP
mmetsp:Transcript_16966/g.53207  ORF Transcript_16966/g.53207 Transcript_16966/m.53207 type:complete len:761 (+) Transcript_16966:56-2338(+)